METDFVLGWGALSLFFTVACVFLAGPLEIAAWGVIIAAILSIAVLYRRDGQIITPGILRVLMLAAPLLLIASAMVPSQWDEFSHWLPAPRFMLLTNDVPSLDNPITGTQMLAAYPYGWPYLTYLASRLSGVYLEGASRVLNVSFLLFFGLLAMRVAVTAAERELPRLISWQMAGVAVLFGTLLNPTFIQKIILTAYADIGTSVTLGVTAYLYWMLLNAQADNNKSKAWQIAWSASLAGLALINIKQVNLVLLIGLAFWYLVVAWRDTNIQLGRSLVLALASVVPAMTLYAVWRYHVDINFATGNAEASFLAFEDWHISKMHLIFLKMLMVAGKKIGFFGPMAIAAGFGIRAYFNVRGPFDRLAILVGGSFLSYNAFLFLTYVASFGERQALTVVSFWRYNTHMGMLAVLFISISAGLLWKRFDLSNRMPRKIVWVPLVLVLLAPFVFAKKLRFDLEPDKPHFTAVARDLISLVPINEPLVFVDPEGTGESGAISRYITNRYSIPYMSAFHTIDFESLGRLTNYSGKQSQVVVHSINPAVSEFYGIPFKQRVSYLLRKDNDTWQVLRKWPYP